MVRVLAVSDEIDEGLYEDTSRAGQVDLIVSCGDLPFDYLGTLMNALEAPLVFVPGNHDPDVSGYRTSRAGLTVRAGLPATQPWPAGAINADGRVVAVAGLTIAGLGGSPRYREGPNQYTEAQQGGRGLRLRWRIWWHRRRRHQPLDLLLTHAPPRDIGDRDDRPHQGFRCLRRIAERTRPRMLLHGHIHPYGESPEDHRLGSITVRNVVGWHLFDVPTVYTGQRVP